MFKTYILSACSASEIASRCKCLSGDGEQQRAPPWPYEGRNPVVLRLDNNTLDNNTIAPVLHLNVISEYFGPELVSDGRGRRISFAEAWDEPQLRVHAVEEATRALARQSQQIVEIAKLLHDALREESGWHE